MKFTNLALLLSILANSQLIYAHGDESPEALVKREAYVSKARRSLSECAEKLRKRGIHHKRVQRRDIFLDKRGIDAGVMKQRDESSSNLISKRQLTDDFDVSALYSESERACILAPEETIGPYYLPTHLYREDIRTTPLQAGIEFLVTIQLIDVKTCNPVPNVMVEFWHCNNLGVYSGFEAEGTLNEDYLRGMQMSDEDGIVQIVTNFPGWYRGRATHIHIATHLNGTLVDSDSSDTDSPASGPGQFYTGGVTPHIGQLYFDESFLEIIDNTAPYTENSDVARLKNEEDNIFMGSGADAAVMAVTLVDGENGDVTKGLIGSGIVGIDLTADYDEGQDRPTGPPSEDGPGNGTNTGGNATSSTGAPSGPENSEAAESGTETGTGTGGSSGMVSAPWVIFGFASILGYLLL